MKLGKRLKSLGGKAAKRVMANEKAMGAVFQAFGRAQSAKKRLDHFQADLLHQMSFAPRGDYQAIGKRITALKRKAKELGDKLGPRRAR